MLALALMIGTTLYAQPGAGYGPGATGGRGLGPCGAGLGPGNADRSQLRQFENCPLLNLSDEQKTQLKELRLEHYKAMKPLKNEMIELKAKERTLMSADDTNMKALNKVIDDQTALMNKMKKIQAENRIEGKKVLTEEQQLLLEQRPLNRNARALKAQRPGRGNGRAAFRGAGKGAGRGYYNRGYWN